MGRMGGETSLTLMPLTTPASPGRAVHGSIRAHQRNAVICTHGIRPLGNDR